ncbi:MAG: AAA family ATPase [Lactimicrobium sp.]|jgi:predicted AAA+ superfamily ATPase|uniref:AAA family ATPase n=1 Tax=Lactimicrobium sp. TaxID=2563780 RepID=UPI002F359805
MEIKRDRYLNMLITKMNNGLIKVITGIRRSGKSYLLFHLFYNYLISAGVPNRNIIVVPLDDIEYEKYRDPRKLFDYIVNFS